MPIFWPLWPDCHSSQALNELRMRPKFALISASTLKNNGRAKSTLPNVLGSTAFELGAAPICHACNLRFHALRLVFHHYSPRLRTDTFRAGAFLFFKAPGGRPLCVYDSRLLVAGIAVASTDMGDFVGSGIGVTERSPEDWCSRTAEHGPATWRLGAFQVRPLLRERWSARDGAGDRNCKSGECESGHGNLHLQGLNLRLDAPGSR
jgi:hypothetical protein